MVALCAAGCHGQRTRRVAECVDSHFHPHTDTDTDTDTPLRRLHLQSQVASRKSRISLSSPRNTSLPIAPVRAWIDVRFSLHHLISCAHLFSTCGPPRGSAPHSPQTFHGHAYSLPALTTSNHSHVAERSGKYATVTQPQCCPRRADQCHGRCRRCASTRRPTALPSRLLAPCRARSRRSVPLNTGGTRRASTRQPR
jgi:hypothetical protein